MEHEHEFLTSTEVAALFGVTLPTVRRWYYAGELEAIRPMGRLLFPAQQPMIALKRQLLAKENGAEVADNPD